MRVVAYDPYIDIAYAEENDITVVTLNELIAQSDVISLHVPLTNETRHLINAERIAQMKDGVIIINTARGGIIDEAAACEAIASGKIGGLGLDAYEKEPPQRSKLFDFDNVVLTPHAAAHTQEAKANMAAMAVDNLIAVLSGDDCRYIVNKASL
jgi:phosphoglycerate dehydrogenase-like enzyme